MRAVGWLVRAFGFVFHIFLALGMIAVATVAWFGPATSLNLGVFPWQGTALVFWLFFWGVSGAVMTLLALRGRLVLLFVLWALAVFAMLFYGYFLSSYTFSSTDGFLTAVAVVVAALVAAFGSVLNVRREIQELKRSSAVV